MIAVTSSVTLKDRRIFELDNKCASLRTEKQDDDYLQNDYTQVILDITFYEENKLVDQEFPEDCSPFKIQQLRQDLTEPEVLAGRLVPAQEVQSVLGLEVLECLYWRRGVLIYMYCHTLHQRKQWIKKNKAIFLKCLQEGICYLMRMLHVRNSVKLNDGVVFHNSATANFLAEGIFSDTHMLMMMYIGEMCFWAVKYEDCSVDIGTQILHKYVLVCDAPLQGQGWNTENAKEILTEPIVFYRCSVCVFAYKTL
uniref:Rab7a interacting mon1-ccz1 complex subunit 1 n=1 Tax=Salmo trutta TaxID=8032 RepID=A0A674DI19_SALTR